MTQYNPDNWSPDRMEVHFGCDCGCGGDSYTIESWGMRNVNRRI